MVGFIHHDEDEQENNLSSKIKNPLDSIWSDKLDFLDQFVPELDDLSLPVNTSLLDFDSIKDWIEEMQDPELEKQPETVTSNGQDVLAEAPNVELTPGIDEELVAADGSGECLVKEREGFENPPVEDAEKLLSLDSVVEDGLGKDSLANEMEFTPVDQSSKEEDVVATEVVEADNDESSDSESERASFSDSSDSSSSSSGEDEDDDVGEGGKNGVIKEGVSQMNEDLEEGEIMETIADKMVRWSNVDGDEDGSKDSFIKDIASRDILMDDDDEDVVVGPIRSKHEVKVLPPVPPVDVTLQPSHQMMSVGVINSILGAQVIVEGAEKHNPLNEGSILWITEKRSPLGRVDEIFGPVKNPYYIVRYNSETEVPEGINEGSLVSFVPEFVDHVLNNKNLYQKGYDASGNDDEEVDEAEFSDDEKEAEYRKMLKTSKRGNKTDTKPGDYKKSNKSFIRNDARSHNSMQPNNNMQNRQFEAPNRPPPDHSVQPGPTRFGPTFTAGFPQQGQPSGFRPNGIQPNGMPFQMQNPGFSNGYQMPWAQQQQNFQPHPMMNARPPFQQAFNHAVPNQNNIMPSNNAMSPSFSSLPAGNMDPNALNQVSMALQAQLAQLSMLSGMLLAGQHGGPSSLPQNAETTQPQFNQGGSPQFNQGQASSHQSGLPQFNQGVSPQFNQGQASSHQSGLPQFNQGQTPSHQSGLAQFNQGPTWSHQGGPPRGPTSSNQSSPSQFNQGPTSSHLGGPSQGPTSSHHQGTLPLLNQGPTLANQGVPPQLNQGSTPPHQGVPPQLNQEPTLSHQVDSPQQFNQGASHEGPPPQFNQGAEASHRGGNKPFQHRGGRSRGRGRGGRRGGGRSFHSR